MPRDGSGVHTLPSGYLAVTGETVLPSNHNPPLEDLSAAVTESIARTGVTSITANIPFNDKRITGLGDAAADTDALNRRVADSRYDSQGAGLAASVGSSALTIRLTTIAGDDPNSSVPVIIPFRSPTSATGTVTRQTVTSATSLVVSSGSTLGFAGTVAGRIWVVAFDDGGTVRLGVINCRNGVNITPLSPSGIASSTAEGGAGAADSAGVFYTGTAVAAKAYTVLGFMEWSAGLAVAGTWGIVPTKIEPYSIGMVMPGERLQRQRATYTTYSTNSTLGAFGNNKMQNTEGGEILSASVTPSSAANVLDIKTVAHIAPTTATSMQAGIFQDSTAAALSQTNNAVGIADAQAAVTVEHSMIAATTSATTFKTRVAAGAGSVAINGVLGGARGGGALVCSLVVEENQA